MKKDPLAATYARALFELAVEAKRVAEVLEEVGFLRRLLAEDPDFRTFVESPGIGEEARRTALEKVFRGRLDDLVVDFLEVVIAKKRQTLLTDMFLEFEDLHDRAAGRIRVEAVTAVPLPDDRRDRLVRALEEKLHKTVLLEDRVRPEILGGLVLRYGDLVADGSLRTDLEEIERRLEETQIETRIGSE